jgi:hypothetical protein
MLGHAEKSVQVFPYDAWPEPREDTYEMNFRLIYQGRLPAVSRGDTRAQDKHRIRKALHPQLRELWKADRYLSKHFLSIGQLSSLGGQRPRFQDMSDEYARCGYRFLPLVGTPAGNEACALDVLFLRRDHPGDLVRHGGDIDNRMKVLLDALRMPDECQELCGESPTEDQDPFFCLLKDDRLITELRIETDRLLTPLATDEHINDVYLVIHVKTISFGTVITI